MWRSVRSGGPPVAGGLQRTSRESVRRMLHCLSRQAKRPITTRPSDKPTRKSPSSSGRTCAKGLLLPVSMHGAANLAPRPSRAAHFYVGTLAWYRHVGTRGTCLRGTAPPPSFNYYFSMRYYLDTTCILPSTRSAEAAAELGHKHREAARVSTFDVGGAGADE